MACWQEVALAAEDQCSTHALEPPAHPTVLLSCTFLILHRKLISLMRPDQTGCSHETVLTAWRHFNHPTVLPANTPSQHLHACMLLLAQKLRPLTHHTCGAPSESLRLHSCTATWYPPPQHTPPWMHVRHKPCPPPPNLYPKAGTSSGVGLQPACAGSRLPTSLANLCSSMPTTLLQQGMAVGHVATSMYCAQGG
jgi:hypothetical protein